MSALFRAIFENEFHRPLKRPPMLLVGGLAAWKKEVDDENVLRRLPSPVPPSPHQLAPAPAFGPPSPSGSEESLSDNAPSPKHTRYPSSLPLNPAYNLPKTNSNISSGSPSDIPITNSITPRRLFELLESRLNILLLDTRTREQFDQERINHDAIVCLEPSVLRREK
jgi:hypothetical protein